MKAFKDLVSITFSGAEATEFMDAVGVMGDFFNGTRYLHDKLRSMDDDKEFGHACVVSTKIQNCMPCSQLHFPQLCKNWALTAWGKHWCQECYKGM